MTGASRGIGRELALDLARHGATVILAARDETNLDDAVEAIRRAGGSANGSKCDVADPDQVQHLIGGVESKYKKIDLLATCAAVAPPANVADCDAESLAHVVNVNLLGTMWCCWAVLPAMRRQRRGQIVTFSSHAAHVPLPGAAAYSSTKAGVAAFSEALHTEVRSDGIHVFTVYPGIVADTDLASADIAVRGAPPKLALVKAADVSAAVLRAFDSDRSQIDLPRGSTAVLRAFDSDRSQIDLPRGSTAVLGVLRSLAPNWSLRRLAY